MILTKAQTIDLEENAVNNCAKNNGECDSDVCSCNSVRVCDHIKTAKEWDEYFSVKGLLDFEDRYVMFVDIMGMRTAMFRSFNRSAIFLGKFHGCLSKLAKDNSDVYVYPVMDGAYVIAKDYDCIVRFIRELYVRLARIFVLTKKNPERFIVRAGLSYGPVVLGERITKQVSESLSNDPDYKSRMLFGLPVILAYQGEAQSSPFGVYLDATVRVKMRDKVSGIWLKWCPCQALKEKLAKEIMYYFDWAAHHSKELLYDEKRLVEHQELARQYFDIAEGA